MMSVKVGQIFESKFDNSKRAIIIKKAKALYVKYLFGSFKEKRVEEALELESFFNLAPESPVK